MGIFTNGCFANERRSELLIHPIVEHGGCLNDMRRGFYAYRKRLAGLVFPVGAHQEISDNLVVKILHQRFNVRRKIVRPYNM